MNAYFNTNHVAGLLFTVTMMAWVMMEVSQRSAQPRRTGATAVARVGGRIVVLACLIVTAAVVNLAPHVVPAATIRPGAVAFAAAWSSCWPGSCCAAGHSRPSASTSPTR